MRTITTTTGAEIVLDGDLRDIKAASPDRYLRVDVAVQPAWVDGQPAEITSSDASGTRLRLAAGADPLALLDRIRLHAPPTAFAVEAPTLSELFLAAAGEPPDDEEAAA